MASEPNAKPVHERPVSYGGFPSSTTWDEDKIYGCVCDSSWDVGMGDGETQEPQWFGPDCSLRHCPSGDDPLTTVDETDCNFYADNGQTWRGGTLVGGDPNLASPTTGIDTSLVAGQDYGASGNLCHVDCSNRGLCDHQSGTCRCFRGHYGQACQLTDALARGEA